MANESRFGLHTQSRRCWALRGQRVVLDREQRFEREIWVWCGGGGRRLDAVPVPPGGQSGMKPWLLAIDRPRRSASRALRHLRSGWRSPAARRHVPARAHSPVAAAALQSVIQSCRKAGGSTQDVTRNRHFADLDQLEEALTGHYVPSGRPLRAACRSFITGCILRQTLPPDSFYPNSMRNGRRASGPLMPDEFVTQRRSLLSQTVWL